MRVVAATIWLWDGTTGAVLTHGSQLGSRQPGGVTFRESVSAESFTATGRIEVGQLIDGKKVPLSALWL